MAKGRDLSHQMAQAVETTRESLSSPLFGCLVIIQSESLLSNHLIVLSSTSIKVSPRTNAKAPFHPA